MKHTRIKKVNNKLVQKTQDDIIRNIYKVKANFVSAVYTSILDNGDSNIVVRMTFAERMMLNNNQEEYMPVSAVAMNIQDFIRTYNAMTQHLQMLREQKKIP